MPIAYEALLTLAAMVGVLIVLLRVIDLPAGADERSAGLWLALAAAAGPRGRGAGGHARRAPQRRLVAHRRDRRARWPRPPEIQTLPAPPPDPASR